MIVDCGLAVTMITAVYSCVLLSFGVLFSFGVQSIVQGHSFSNFLHCRPLATLGMRIVVHWRHCGSHGVLADTWDADWTARS